MGYTFSSIENTKLTNAYFVVIFLKENNAATSLSPTHCNFYNPFNNLYIKL